MSAANLFARHDGAWILADGASYDHYGRVIGLNSKVIASEDLRILIGSAGRFASDYDTETGKWLAEQADQSSALAGAPDLLRMLCNHDAEAQANGAAETSGPIPAGQRLIIALWDTGAGIARAFAISSTSDLGRTPPFTLRPLKTMFSPPLSADPWPGHSFDPVKDAVALGALQRLVEDENGIHRVGGSFEAWRVYAGGIERRVVCTWPDVVGERLRVAD